MPAWLTVERPSLWRSIRRGIHLIASAIRNRKGRSKMQVPTLSDKVWDEMSLVRNLSVTQVAADDEAVTFRASIDIVIDREHFQHLTNAADRKKQGTVKYLRRILTRGFNLFFADEELVDRRAA